jgi:LCP family protein required for cell wall assembly
LWIELPNYANRINTLDVVGGTKLLKQVLQVKLGIPIHYYARIDFGGFVKAVDALGGITVDVECRVAEAGWIDIPAGPVKMDGTMALAFSRTRHTTSDFDRMRRQQAVLLAIRKKLLSPDVLPRLPEVVKQLVAMTDTDIPPQTILALTKLGAEIDLKNVRGFLIDESKVRSWRTSSGAQVLLPDQAKIQAGVQNIWTGQPLTDAIKRPRSCK